MSFKKQICLCINIRGQLRLDFKTNILSHVSRNPKAECKNHCPIKCHVIIKTITKYTDIMVDKASCLTLQAVFLKPSNCFSKGILLGNCQILLVNCQIFKNTEYGLILQQNKGTTCTGDKNRCESRKYVHHTSHILLSFKTLLFPLFKFTSV